MGSLGGGVMGSLVIGGGRDRRNALRCTRLAVGTDLELAATKKGAWYRVSCASKQNCIASPESSLHPGIGGHL